MQMCDGCGKNQANIHLTQIVNNETSVFHFCEECAAKKGISINIGDAGSVEAGQQKSVEVDKECPKCGTKLSDFREKGWLGCPACYDAFFDEVERLLTQVHGSSEHKGKQYANKPPSRRKPSVKQLRLELDSAIQNEEFERAAELRDAIKDLTISEEAR
jgi:protein arginine kinase activator